MQKEKTLHLCLSVGGVGGRQ